MTRPLSIYKQRRLNLIEALESGEYKQAKSALRVEDKFCCLGVACDLHRKAKDNSEKYSWDDIKHSTGTALYLNEESGLPDEVSNWYAFRGRLPGDAIDIDLKYIKKVLTEEEINQAVYENFSFIGEGNQNIDIVYINDAGVSFKKIGALMRLQFNLPKE